MRTRLNLFLSHATVAAAGIAVLVLLGAFAPAIQYGVAIVVLFLLAAASAYLLGRHGDTNLALEMIERAVVEGEKPTGNSPFDRCAERLQGHVQRWSQIAAQGRSQARELDSVLALFEQDEIGRKQHENPAKQVRHWLSSLGRDANVTLRELIDCNQSIDGIGKELTASSQEQNEIATKANREVESLQGDVGDLKQHTTKAQQTLAASRSQMDTTQQEVGTLSRSQLQVRTEIGNCEHKVRAMRDHTAAIQSMTQTIHEHSARADMLALNASIEAVRAGELGRGFAGVAEEIRKLANQINTAASDALEKIAAVDAEVDEASSLLASERDQLGRQETQLTQIHQSVSELHANTEQFHEQLGRLDGVSTNQLRRLGEVETAIEGILAASDHVRNQVVEGNWKTRSSTEHIARLLDVLEPLMVSCSQEEEVGPVVQQEQARGATPTADEATEIAREVETACAG